MFFNNFLIGTFSIFFDVFLVFITRRFFPFSHEETPRRPSPLASGAGFGFRRIHRSNSQPGPRRGGCSLHQSVGRASRRHRIRRPRGGQATRLRVHASGEAGRYHCVLLRNLVFIDGTNKNDFNITKKKREKDEKNLATSLFFSAETFYKKTSSKAFPPFSLFFNTKMQLSTNFRLLNWICRYHNLRRTRCNLFMVNIGCMHTNSAASKLLLLLDSLKFYRNIFLS